MFARSNVARQLHVHRGFAVRFLTVLVASHGTYIIAATLLDQIAAHHGTHLNDFLVDIPLLVGLSVLYLSTLLRRRKRTAWLVTVLAYAFYLGIGVTQLFSRMNLHTVTPLEVVRMVALPSAILALLFVFEKEFVVKSDIQGFRHAVRFSCVILLVALLYGVAGFTLLDESDFHQEVNLASSIHYTIDQFDLTTDNPLRPSTRRAHLFVDSLSFVSVGAVAYAVVSLFQPLRVRLSDQRSERERVLKLLNTYGAASEEFFKIWPHDKQYFFDDSGESAIAFHAYRGVALCVSDPIGNPERFDALLEGFGTLCFSNDWLPAFIHVADGHRALYEKHGFVMQKLGQDAVIDIDHFDANVANSKYFRQIRNKFSKQGYSCELLTPPHHTAVLDRLHSISTDWLSQGSRAERGFVMGYYSTDYMQQCDIMVARDAAGTIQAFMNMVPAAFDPNEATYDLLRSSNNSLGNINDYLLMNAMANVSQRGYTRLSLGLCPLGGLDDTDSEMQKTLIDNVLKFAYANGDRFYSFSGLHRFKAKYQPEWQDRYLAYQGGVRGFSKTMTALTRSMRIAAK